MIFITKSFSLWQTVSETEIASNSKNIKISKS